MSKHKSLLHKYKYIKYIFSVVAIALAVGSPFIFGTESCNDPMKEMSNTVSENLQNTSIIGNSSTNNNGSSGVRLGKKKENPYTIANMEKAYKSLYKKTNGELSRTTSPVRKTHYYVKFKPNTDEDYERLQQDTINIKFLLPFPVDYEIIGQGAYRDPSVPAGQPTPRYTAVRVDYTFPPNIPYEILEELYLPEEDDALDSDNDRKNLDGTFTDVLVEESMLLTKNISQNEASVNTRLNWGLPSRYRPQGNITMYDARNIRRGIEGAVVRAGYWYTHSSGIVDSTGNYVCDDTFRYAVQYYIEWLRWDFAIEADDGDNAHYWGPDRKDDWTLVIERSTGLEQWKYAEMFRAAYKMYYGDIEGLNRPPANCWACEQMDIQLDRGQPQNRAGRAHQVDLFHWRQTYINYSLEYNRIYNTTLHELAHHIHAERSGWLDMANTSPCVKESFANGVAWRFTAAYYPSFVVNDAPFQRGGDVENYTDVVADLIEAGVSIDQVRNGIRIGASTTWNQWRDEIIHQNPTLQTAITNIFADGTHIISCPR